ncbi:BREX-2 system adenine-specific DNA-methyltransferase PglX [Phytohabitans kaempferiae]|uniref:site-specific DNA-methyltransferase (adenine-specific) n=1 Tax=Phytohabitans kaempferiae TaxID=1620943 RepID=A0ABV6MEF7_9ACTN
MTQHLPMKALQRQLKALVDDLREQSTAVPELRELLEEQYQHAFGHRTGATYEEWREEQLDQAAVAWLLGTVFVRFCEDNQLISGVWLAGPGGRTEAAVQAQTAYFLKEPKHNDRHWILAAFDHLRDLRATAGILDTHNPVWRFPISADAASALLDFWRRGPGAHSFVDDKLDTRFLGDLYQDLSEYARKRYALLQTPEFVEGFILDLTLTPSIAEYGLEETSVIDPTCGSGHFLLGAFARLHKLWREREPATDPHVRVQRALDQVTGVDINPFAVAIAKFRLLVAAFQACGQRSLETAPGFRLRLAAGDSLLRWGADSSHQGDLLASLEGREEYPYFTEHGPLLADYLRPGQYTVAVGNPPYRPVKDKVLNERYRQHYKTCAGKYALSVPFAERFFQLIRPRDESGRSGFVGKITANSFMKREFGKKLIEEFFAHEVELSHVIDASGADITGHSTATVILVGRRRLPNRPTLRAVMGVVGKRAEEGDPPGGPVWQAIVDNINHPGATTPYVTIADLPRSALSRYPWSLTGGGAGDVKAAIDSAAARRLSAVTQHSGFVAITAEDDAFFLGGVGTARRMGGLPVKPMVEGDAVRDHSINPKASSVWPYDANLRPVELATNGPLTRLAWPNRRILQRRKRFGRWIETIDSLCWYEYGELYREKLRTPWSITYAFVATHNHFALDRDGRIFNRSAPVIKLPENASDDDHLALLGLLNSSTACFWLKQVSHCKNNVTVSSGIPDQPWSWNWEFTGTKLEEFPIPLEAPLRRARRIDQLAQELVAVLPSAIASAGTPTRDGLNKARAEYDRIRGEMVATQEELDWEVYRLYGLLDQDVTAPEESIPRLNLGERAFEIVLARKIAAAEATTEWFARHGSTPMTEIPAHWPQAYAVVVERRIQIIEERQDIALIERPECKRRWQESRENRAWGWPEQEEAAIRDWLLDRLEAEPLWREAGRARVLSVAQLADRIGPDEDFRSVLALYCGREDYNLTAELTKLVADETVPFLARYRYKPSGLRKREQWERTWDLQRREDRGEKLDEPIPVPPKYTSADFAKTSYWRNRGKLDVPKERFILYPKAGRDADKTPVIGWAGWNHLDQAQALATLCISRKTEEGWPVERLLPLLAGLVELEPWLNQWHSDPVPGYVGSPAAFYTSLIDTELAAFGRGRADLAPEKLP